MATPLIAIDEGRESGLYQPIQTSTKVQSAGMVREIDGEASLFPKACEVPAKSMAMLIPRKIRSARVMHFHFKVYSTVNTICQPVFPAALLVICTHLRP